MNGEAQFIDKLNGLLKLAKENGNQISVEEVKAYFSEDALTEAQMDLMFEYLMAQKISVMGYVKIGEESEVELLEEEKQYLKEYEEELAGIPQEKPGERSKLIASILQGDVSAKARFIELYMRNVVEIAKKLKRPEVFLGDLIQEGNLGLVLGVELLTDEESADDVMIMQIEVCMKLLLDEQEELANRDKKMVEKVQALDEAITTLTEELGRKVTIDELAIHVGLGIEEIEDILKLAGEDTEPEGEE